jgi:hypothetical protein
MLTIKIKSKVKTMQYVDGTLAYQYINVPTLTRAHCDMPAFRDSKAYGSYANSDLFPSMLAGIKKTVAPKGYIRLDDIPTNVSIDSTGFLATLTISVNADSRA